MSRPALTASVIGRALGIPEPLALDDAMLRRLERALQRVEPDPLFRRRLRGEVLNRYVAAREGHLRGSPRRREMGTLGRSVLYASLVLAISLSAAGAAAQESLPGDLLYTTKLQLEEIRMRIAPPSVRDDLVAIALAERVEELDELAERGSWSLVPAAAARVLAAEEALLALDPGSSAAKPAQAEATQVLEAVLIRAPEAARPGLAQALNAAGDGPQPGGEPAAPGRPQHSSTGQGPASSQQPAQPGTSASPVADEEPTHPGRHNRFRNGAQKDR